MTDTMSVEGSVDGSVDDVVDDLGAPPPLAGSAQVGSELWRSLGQIHSRAGAHREQMENALSAGAKELSFDLIKPARVGAERDAHDMLAIFTDTAIDLTVALDFGHSKAKDTAEVKNKGTLNNFGIGLKVFQASLGLHTQVAIFTYRRLASGGEVFAIARMGSAIDAHFARLSRGGVVHVNRVVVTVLRAADGTFAFDWGGLANEDARAAMLGADSPWATEAAAVAPMHELMRRVGESELQTRGTLFLYHTDGTEPLPYQLVHDVADEEEGGDAEEPLEVVKVEVGSDDGEVNVDAAEASVRHGTQLSAADVSVVLPPPARLHVRDKDGVWKDVATTLESSYISDDISELHELAAAEGAPLKPAPTLPRVSVQARELQFDRHAWCVEQRRDGASLGEFFPVYVNRAAAPIAFVRCCHMDLAQAWAGHSTRGERLQLHKQGVDGAFFVMHGRKVINETPTAMFDGTVFEEATSRFEPFVKLAIHGGQGELVQAKYELLKTYWAAGCDAEHTAPLSKELEFEWAKKHWKPKATQLWPAVGAGVLSVVHLSPSFFELDPSKTRVLRRDGEASLAGGITLGELVSAIRVGIAHWCATTRAPELPAPVVPRAAPVPPRPRPRVQAGGGSSSPPGEELVGSRISCFWHDNNQWFDGIVDACDLEGRPQTPYHISYDDGDEEWLLLREGEYKLLAAAAALDGELPELPAAAVTASGGICSGRRKTQCVRLRDISLDSDQPASKRAARTGKAHAAEASQKLKDIRRVAREQEATVKREASSGDLMREMQALRAAFTTLVAKVVQ